MRVIPMWDTALEIASCQPEYDRRMADTRDPIANRQKAADAETARQNEVKRLSQEVNRYHNWLDDWFAGEFRIRRRVARAVRRKRRRRVERS